MRTHVGEHDLFGSKFPPYHGLAKLSGIPQKKHAINSRRYKGHTVSKISETKRSHSKKIPLCDHYA
jgi:hypothetical protein